MTDIKTRDSGGLDQSPPESRSTGGRIAELLLRRRESTIAIAALILAVYFAVSNDVFFSTPNIRIISQYLIATAILATGQTMLLISGEIDLSMGNVFFMTPFLVFFGIEAGLPLPVAILVGVLGAGVVGLLNGAISIGAGIPSFIVTLGMGFVINGVTLNISDGFPKRPPSAGLASDIFGGAAFSGLVWVVVIVAVMHLVLTKTRWGVYTIAIGGNRTGAKEAGVPSTRIRMRNFVVAAMLAGFAGVIEGIRIGSFDPGAGVAGARVFESVAAAVIGGTLLTGGAGTVIGAFLGALVLAILKDGFVIQGVSAFTYSMVLGAAIIVAMVLNSFAAKVRIRSQSRRL
ncbi:MAG: ABC transporter permease [Actinomycetota bacterium]|nr:ABC transporter permease [Actinomycetota bacterium]